MYTRFARFLSATSLLVMLGCSTPNAIVDDLKGAAIQAAFETIKSAAEANGGTAAMIDGETTIEVTDPASPIAGAKVLVPAGAIPADVEHAAVAIQGGTLPEEQADDVKTAGPGAMVALQNLRTGEPITPQAKLKITLPFKEDTAYPKDEFNLGLQDEALAFTPVEGSATDDGIDTVTGESDATGLFAAIWPVHYESGPAAENTVIFTVMKDGAKVCAGLYEDAASRLGLSSVYYDGNGEFPLNLGFVDADGLRVTVSDSFNTAPNPESLSTPHSFTDVRAEVDCDGTVYAEATGTQELTMVSWTTVIPYGAADCAGGGDCWETWGSVRFQGEMAYADASGAEVRLAFDVTAASFSWKWDN